MFIREFKVIDATGSVEQLRMRLKSEELEQYGEPFIPEFVYEAIKKLSRFSSMRVSLFLHCSCRRFNLFIRDSDTSLLFSVVISRMLKSFLGSSWNP